MVDLENYLSKEVYGSFINGKEYFPEGVPIDFISPLHEGAWKKVRPATRKETELAIMAAQRVFPFWSKTNASERTNILRKIANLMDKYRHLLAKTMTYEMGKCIKESYLEVDYSIGFFNWFAGEAERIYGLSIPSPYSHKNLKIVYEPVGVCGIITPWNFPLAMGSKKIAAALAAGCSCVIKPSPETPFSMLLLANICQEAGLPDGVVNVLIGHEKEIGISLLDSPTIRKISFTGSTKVGKYLYEKSAATMKKLTLELGGHAPFIIYEDANLDVAVTEAIVAKFRNSGQTCMSANRFLIQESIRDEFLTRFKLEIEKLIIGNPLDERSDLTTILHPISIMKVNEQLEDALAKGAELYYATEHPYEPKILSGITPGMKIFREETFGPIAPILSFKTFDEAITLANASEYGLAAYVFTKDMKRANQTVSKLEYGVIGVNDGLPSVPQASFGGIKSSGLGREGGPTGIYEYLNEKFVSIAF